MKELFLLEKLEPNEVVPKLLTARYDKICLVKGE